MERLARVRENQRKSRARKQEYVNELEQRLAACKEQAHQKDIEHRLATQKVEAENRHLKALLGSLGVSSASVQQYLQEADTGANTNRKVAIPAIQRVEGENALSQPRRDTRRSNLSMAVPHVYKKESETTELPMAVNSTCANQQISHQIKLHKKKIRLCVDADPIDMTRKRYLMKMCSIRRCVPLRKK